jgi:hypothetical protein
MRVILINLHDRAERRASMENQIRKLGLSQYYSRLEASDNRTGDAELGCFDSHMRALKLAYENHTTLHIAEDDIEFSPSFGELLRGNLVLNSSENFDLIFLDMWIDLGAIPQYLTALRKSLETSEIALLDMKNLRIGSAASYLVKPHCIPRLLDRLSSELAAGRPDPIDKTYGKLVKSGYITAAVAIPFLTGSNFHALHSDIQKIPEDFMQLLLSVRAIFKIDQDRALLATKVSELLKAIEGKYFPVRLARPALNALLDFSQSSDKPAP